MIGKIRLEKINPDKELAAGKHYRLFLNDVDISQFVSSININLTPNELPLAIIQIRGNLEIPEDMKAEINTYILETNVEKAE